MTSCGNPSLALASVIPKSRPTAIRIAAGFIWTINHGQFQEPLTKPFEGVAASDDTPKAHVGLMNIRTALIPNAKSSVLVKPGDGSFYDPSCLPQPTAVFCVAACSDRYDSHGTQFLAMGFGVIGPIILDAIRAVTRFALL